MKEILYLEVPTPDLDAVRTWLQQQWIPEFGEKTLTPDGIKLKLAQSYTPDVGNISDISVFVWSVQRTTYLKAFRTSTTAISSEKKVLQHLTTEIRKQFPNQYPEPPEVNLSQQSIFEALAPHYPLTVKYFQKMPNGEYDLKRVYWWEKRWRDSVRNPQQPTQVVFKGQVTGADSQSPMPTYDLIYIGGALGVIHAAVMAQLGYRVLLLERLPFGRMNREWNISRQELQSLIDLGLFTAAEVESLIAREYVDGFNKF
ncbi:MAG TPA: flavin-dependent dehydrogenase, partial [Candidatus Sericytochromatia bacterium]